VYRFVTLDWFIFAVMLMGVFYGIFIVDFCYSVQLIKKIRALAKEMRMEIDWDHLKVEIREDLKKRKVKTSFLSPFNTPFGLSSHVKSHNIGGVKGRMKRTK